MTKFNRPPTARQWLKNQTSLRGILRHSAQLKNGESILKQHLPIPLQRHCQLANYRENILFLHADSAAWATKLRYYVPKLTESLKKTFYFKNLKKVTINTRPNDNHGPAYPHKPHRFTISKDTAKLINNLADSVTNDELANSLKRLARRGYFLKNGGN